MKKILMLMAVILFSAASVFSQVSTLTISWEEEECGCSDQGNSYYGVRYSIEDTENDIVVNAGTLVKVDFGTYEVVIEVPEVDANCALHWAARYTVYYGVGVFCDSSNPPEELCGTQGLSIPNITCAQFAAGISPPECTFN